jgi:8-oxo-dGTP diphosphatase
MKLAGCIITDAQERVLLLHRNSGPHEHWEVPGGKVEPGEDTQQTAAREIKEELGVEVDIVRKLGWAAFHEADEDMDYTWYEAVVTDGEPTVMEPDKFDGLAYFSLDEMRSVRLSTGAWNFLGMLEDEKVALGENVQ